MHNTTHKQLAVLFNALHRASLRLELMRSGKLQSDTDLVFATFPSQEDSEDAQRLVAGLGSLANIHYETTVKGKILYVVATLPEPEEGAIPSNQSGKVH